MDGFSYANCNGDKGNHLPPRKFECIDEWGVLVGFFFGGGGGGGGGGAKPIMAICDFYELGIIWWG
jgi:hypothetical protein